MPNQIVASQLLAVALRQLSNGVSIIEGENILLGLRCIPLSRELSVTIPLKFQA